MNIVWMKTINIIRRGSYLKIMTLSPLSLEIIETRRSVYATFLIRAIWHGGTYPESAPLLGSIM